LTSEKRKGTLAPHHEWNRPLSQLSAAFLYVFLGLFPIVNPMGVAPIFLQWTSGVTPEMRHRLVWRISLGSFFLMVASFLVGSHILAWFGLTLAAVQIAGGLVLLNAGWRMLQQGDEPHLRKKQANIPEEQALTRAFFPLTLPLTVGPGTISVAIAMGAKGGESADIYLYALGGCLGCLALAVFIYVCYRFAEKLVVLLGTAGTDVVMRLSAFILLCLSVQIIWRGIHSLMTQS